MAPPNQWAYETQADRTGQKSDMYKISNKNTSSIKKKAKTGKNTEKPANRHTHWKFFIVPFYFLQIPPIFVLFSLGIHAYQKHIQF